MSNPKLGRFTFAVVAAALGVGCATVSEPPLERLVASQSAVRAAEEVGAGQSPRAAYHLRLAKEHVVTAKRLMARGQHAEADVYLQKAAADADVALALTKQIIAMKSAERVKKEIASLQNPEPGRKP